MTSDATKRKDFELISFRPIRSPDEIDDAIRQLDKSLASADQRHKGKPALRNIVRQKRALLPKLQEEWAGLRKEQSILFVSLAKSLHDELASLRKIAITHGFTQVLTGFDEDMVRRGTLREGIFAKIAKSSAFLGIWSDDIKFAATATGEQYASPGVWMPLELGAALYAQKPFKLLVKAGVLPQLINPVAEFPHGWYKDQRSFDEQADQLIGGLRATLDGIARS